MRGGFRPLVHPGTLVSDVDLESTRAVRERLHEEIGLRAHLVQLLTAASPGDDLVRVTPYRVIEGNGDCDATEGAA